MAPDRFQISSSNAMPHAEAAKIRRLVISSPTLLRAGDAEANEGVDVGEGCGIGIGVGAGRGGGVGSRAAVGGGDDPLQAPMLNGRQRGNRGNVGSEVVGGVGLAAAGDDGEVSDADGSVGSNVHG